MKPNYRKRHIRLFIQLMALCLLCSNSACEKTNETVTEPDLEEEIIGGDVEFWMTRGDKSVLFEKQDSLPWTDTSSGYTTITVDSSQRFQEIDGFGFSLTGASAYVINQMSEPEKTALLEDLFLTDDDAIGISYLRISIGASDLSAAPFTYDETPDGEADENLDYFTIAEEQADLLPVLKRVVALNPDIKILATPWTAPTWMKSNLSFVGGELEKAYYDAYALYFIKYIQAMANEGIIIDAVTVQNEPLHDGNNPSMYMSAADQTEFVKDHLGPKFEANNILTKIIIYDHNLDRISYPLSILADADAAQYIDGSAFHLYAGDISSLSTVYAAYPDKKVYFTEQWTSANGDFAADLQWHVSNLIIGATRNWSSNVLEWNLATDTNYGPYTVGGCDQCQGALTIDGDAVTKNVSYYIIAHASKFVRPGSVRIASDSSDDLQTVAFQTPEGKTVLIVLNNSTSITTKFSINFNGKMMSSSLWSGAVGTYIWD